MKPNAQISCAVTMQLIVTAELINALQTGFLATWLIFIDNRAYQENTNFKTSVPRNLKFHRIDDLQTTKKC